LQRASLRLSRTRGASLRGRPFFMAFLTMEDPGSGDVTLKSGYLRVFPAILLLSLLEAHFP
jgi:hypothetical protein